MQFHCQMKSFLSHSLVTVLLCLPFAACTGPQQASVSKNQEGGDSFTGTVIESTPERITIKIKDKPQLLVIEGDQVPVTKEAVGLAQR